MPEILGVFEDLRTAIERDLPASRERAVALTNLDSARLWTEEALRAAGRAEHGSKGGAVQAEPEVSAAPWASWPR
jgi:hypothetical protein